MTRRIAVLAALVSACAFAQVSSIPAAAGGNGSGVTGLSVNGDTSVNSAVAITWASCSTPTFNAGGTTTVNWALSNCAKVTASGGNTTIAFSNPHGAGQYSLALINDGTARVWTMPGTALNAATPAVASTGTYQTFQYDGSTNYQGLAASSTEAGVGRAAEVTAPVTPAATQGAFWFDSTDHLLESLDNANAIPAKMVRNIVGPTIAGTAIALLSDQVPAADTLSCNTVAANTEQVFATTYTIPANYLTASTGLRVEISFNSVSTAAFALTPRVRLGGTALTADGTIIYTSSPGNFTTGTTDAGFEMGIHGTAAVGAAAPVWMQLFGAVAGFGKNTTTSFNNNFVTTGTLLVKASLACATQAVGNTLQITGFKVFGN